MDVLWNMEEEALPPLAVTSLSEDTFLLMDTRGLEETEEIQFLDSDQASVVLAGRRLDEADAISFCRSRLTSGKPVQFARKHLTAAGVVMALSAVPVFLLIKRVN